MKLWYTLIIFLWNQKERTHNFNGRSNVPPPSFRKPVLEVCFTPKNSRRPNSPKASWPKKCTKNTRRRGLVKILQGLVWTPWVNCHFLSQGVIREQETNAKMQEEGQVKQMNLSWKWVYRLIRLGGFVKRNIQWNNVLLILMFPDVVWSPFSVNLLFLAL